MIDGRWVQAGQAERLLLKALMEAAVLALERLQLTVPAAVLQVILDSSGPPARQHP